MGGAVRVGKGSKKVLIVQNHKGERSISWSLEPETRMWDDIGEEESAARTWDEMGEEQWAEVGRVLEEVKDSRELVEGMRNIEY